VPVRWLAGELARVAIGAVVAIVVGLTTHAWGLGLALGVIGWVAWHVREFIRFDRWSRHPLARPNHAAASWGRATERVYRSLAASRARSRRLLSELRGFTTITRQLPDGAVLIRPGGEIEMFNDAASKLFGLEAPDRGNNLVALVRVPAFRALVDGRVALVEMNAPRDPNVHLEVRRIDIDPQRVLILARDVTQLNRLLTMRQDFVANVSHELRTPLTVILGYLETMEDESLSERELKTLLERFRGPVRRMESLVEDLLLLTRLESNPRPAREDLSVVRVESLLRAIRDDALALSGGRHEIVLEATRDLAILGMEGELHSAFSNLVMNAVRYSPDGGRIEIRWHATADGARFEVADHGVGIAPEHLSRITERFYRVDFAGARVRGGTGLGLAITKHVLERHGATLTVESEHGKGSRFGCTFPRDLVVAPSAPARLQSV